MSVNKLNLQIGGSREPEEDTLLEETGVSIEVDDLIADLFDDNKEEIVEEHGDFLVKACLLYTSPSPRDRQKSRMPSSA